jgi:hypothetical protein
MRHCFRYLNHTLGGMQVLEGYLFRLMAYLSTEMKCLHHNTGVPLCVLYGHHSHPSLTLSQSTQGTKYHFISPSILHSTLIYSNLCLFSSMEGPVIAFNLQWADGSPVGFVEVGRQALEKKVHLRTGWKHNELLLSFSFP